jgi:hypothetical protein
MVITKQLSPASCHFFLYSTGFFLNPTLFAIFIGSLANCSEIGAR